MTILGIIFVLIAGIVSAQTLVCPPDAPAEVKLAAKEILHRYVCLRTGELLPIAGTGKGIALKVDPTLNAQESWITTDSITGGSDTNP